MSAIKRLKRLKRLNLIKLIVILGLSINQLLMSFYMHVKMDRAERKIDRLIELVKTENKQK